jgi:hypothetical protein
MFVYKNSNELQNFFSIHKLHIKVVKHIFDEDVPIFMWIFFLYG